MKFGGTSVGVPEAFRVAVGQVVVAREQDTVVVVSALNQVTNLLVEFCAHVDRRQAVTEQLLTRHRGPVEALGLEPSLLDAGLAALSRDLAALPPRPAQGEARDRVLAHGERLAATIFAAGLMAHGAQAR